MAITWKVQGDQLVLSGRIDEKADLVGLVARAERGRLVLDLGGITFISSFGVREWIRMQQAAAGAGVRIELRRVAEPLVHQMNIVAGARGVSIVSSFFAPYACDNCDIEHEVLLDVRTHGPELARGRAPAMSCPKCNRPMEFAHPPELYFQFITG